jgi:biopolymer transport protein ExbB/biopolymer transport protein TolQ
MFQTIIIIAMLTLNGFAQEPPPAANANTPKETTSNDGGEKKSPDSTNAKSESDGSKTPDVGDKEPKNAEATEKSEANTTAVDAKPVPAKATPPPPPVKKLPQQSSNSEASTGSHFTVEEMWSQSSGPVRTVLLTLLFMLVWAMGVGLERYITISVARRQSRALVPIVTKHIAAGDTEKALAEAQSKSYEKSYFAKLLDAGLTEFNARQDKYGIEAVERALDKNSIQENSGLRKGLNVLATVGSTAPFVGLVGTIFGIINAFSQIGAEGGADLTTLAPAIGEALITTAFGIIVAIVGVWLFNFFTALIEGINNDMASSAQELLDWCHKRILSDSNAAK